MYNWCHQGTRWKGKTRASGPPEFSDCYIAATAKYKRTRNRWLDLSSFAFRRWQILATTDATSGLCVNEVFGVVELRAEDYQFAWRQVTDDTVTPADTDATELLRATKSRIGQVTNCRVLCRSLSQ